MLLQFEKIKIIEVSYKRLKVNKTGNARIIVTLRHVHATTVAVEKQ